jgi:hypothetical protein
MENYQEKKYEPKKYHHSKQKIFNTFDMNPIQGPLHNVRNKATEFSDENKQEGIEEKIRKKEKSPMIS